MSLWWQSLHSTNDISTNRSSTMFLLTLKMFPDNLSRVHIFSRSEISPRLRQVLGNVDNVMSKDASRQGLWDSKKTFKDFSKTKGDMEKLEKTLAALCYATFWKKRCPLCSVNLVARVSERVSARSVLWPKCHTVACQWGDPISAITRTIKCSTQSIIFGFKKLYFHKELQIQLYENTF